MTLFEPIFQTLNRAGVRYIVVGGVAVVLQGFARLTADLDLIIDLTPPEARRTIDALMELGFRPRAPVDPQDFADTEIRKSWVEAKGMRVFSMFDPTNPMRQVDVFTENPIAFEELWGRSEMMELPQSSVRVASISDLIRLKQLAGRPQDLADIEALEAILERRVKGDG